MKMLTGKKDLRVSNAQTDEQQTQFVIPIDLLEVILSLLTMEDNIRASAVCKTWLAVAISIRIEEKSLWILYRPIWKRNCKYTDPLRKKTYIRELPEICFSKICYSMDNWLLVWQPQTGFIFFLHIWDQKIIRLPDLKWTPSAVVAFSARPTSPSCMLFMVKHVGPTVVDISTCRPRSTKWNTANFLNNPPVSNIWDNVLNKVVFCNGSFYYLNIMGWLGVFNPEKNSWAVYMTPPPKCVVTSLEHWWNRFMAKHNEDAVVIYTCSCAYPMVYKFDQACKTWVETETLEGMTLSVDYISSVARKHLPNALNKRTDENVVLMSNVISFSKGKSYARCCVCYFFEDGRFYTRQEYFDMAEQYPFESVWVYPPESENLCAFLNKRRSCYPRI